MIEIERAIETLEDIRDVAKSRMGIDNGGRAAVYIPQDKLPSLDTALSALRAQQARENPQPLTLEELRERDGKPVWSCSGSDSACGIVDAERECLVGLRFEISFCHLVGTVYDRPPKEPTP